VTTEMTRAGSHTSYFGDLDSKSFDVTLRGTYAFTRTLTLQAYLQPFVASGHYGRVTAATTSGAKPLLPLDSFVDATLPNGVQPDFPHRAINPNPLVPRDDRPP